MGADEQLNAVLERSEVARKGSAAWQLGLPVKPYVWRRDDPDRNAKIAAEQAEIEKVARRFVGHDERLPARVQRGA